MKFVTTRTPIPFELWVAVTDRSTLHCPFLEVRDVSAGPDPFLGYCVRSMFFTLLPVLDRIGLFVRHNFRHTGLKYLTELEAAYETNDVEGWTMAFRPRRLVPFGDGWVGMEQELEDIQEDLNR
jgi:hypothetical protein